MNKFFFKILILYFVVFISIAGFFTLADGNTDAFYVRFSSPRQNSLIIGSSRAAQGIVPSVINNELKKIGFNASLFNYAFALGYSSFGPSYYKSIQKKLTPASKEGLFILEVNPWTISDRSETPEDTTYFIEKTLPIGSLKKVSGHPNFDYLIKYYDPMYISIIVNKLKSLSFFRSKLNTTFLHEDGWLEVSLKMDERSVNSRHKKTIGEYKNTAPKYYNFSNIRYGYLKKTVRYLQTRGDVYLVRLPTHNEIYETENSYMPDFSEKMLSVAEQFGVKFIDLSDSNQNVLFTDGNHLWKESGEKISLDIAREILKNY